MTRLVCWHRLWLTSCWRCRVVAYLDEIIDADRSREAARNLNHHLSLLPAAVTDAGIAASTSTSSSVEAAPHLSGHPSRQRSRPEPSPVGSPSAPVRVLVIDEADVATSP